MSPQLHNAAKPTYFTTIEGGQWVPWHNHPSAHDTIYSIRFSDDTVFNLYAGTWEKYRDPQEVFRDTLIEQLKAQLDDTHLIDASGKVNCQIPSLERVIRNVLELWKLEQS